MQRLKVGDLVRIANAGCGCSTCCRLSRERILFRITAIKPYGPFPVYLGFFNSSEKTKFSNGFNPDQLQRDEFLSSVVDSIRKSKRRSKRAKG